MRDKLSSGEIIVAAAALLLRWMELFVLILPALARSVRRVTDALSVIVWNRLILFSLNTCSRRSRRIKYKFNLAIPSSSVSILIVDSGCDQCVLSAQSFCVTHKSGILFNLFGALHGMQSSNGLKLVDAYTLVTLKSGAKFIMHVNQGLLDLNPVQKESLLQPYQLSKLNTAPLGVFIRLHHLLTLMYDTLKGDALDCADGLSLNVPSYNNFVGVKAFFLGLVGDKDESFSDVCDSMSLYFLFKLCSFNSVCEVQSSVSSPSRDVPVNSETS